MERLELEPYLANRSRELNCLIRRCKISLNHAPEGKLIVNRVGKRICYYKVIRGQRIYLNQTQEKTIQALAQKAYHEKVLESAQYELKQIRDIQRIKRRNKPQPEDIYEKLSADRKALVLPIVPTDEMYAEEWRQKAFEPLDYFPVISEFTTHNSVQVRSKSELIIANMLEEREIPYFYEPQLFVGNKAVRPDFLILNLRTRKEYYWEHFGKMDDPDYIETMVEKMNRYKLNGIQEGNQLICTYETRNHPLSTAVLEALIANYLL